MKKYKFILLIAVTIFSSTAYAQYEGDALLFSQTNYGSTARIKAMGNAQIGTGGDMSSMSANPAGLGLFTKSEFAFTPEFNSAKASGSYLNLNTETTKGTLNLNQIGLVFSFPTYIPKGITYKPDVLNVVLGIGYNRNNDFNMESNYVGNNYSNSIANHFAERVGSINPNNLTTESPEGQAYDSYLINYDQANGRYLSGVYNGNLQSKNNLRRGSTSEFNFSGAINIKNRLYLGMSIGVVHVRYINEAIFTESGTQPELNSSNVQIGTKSYTAVFNQNQATTGSGVNIKLGVIFKPIDFVKIGASLHTPTWMSVTDSYDEGLGGYQNVNYDAAYQLRTPMKSSLGTSFIIANHAILSADIDYVDYSTIKFSTDSRYNNYVAINNNNKAVRDTYTNAVNYRIGGEYKLNMFSIRAGYGVNGSPNKQDNKGTFDTQMYSGGIGYRNKNYYFDLTYQQVKNQSNTAPYTLADGSEPVAFFKNTISNTFLTCGVRF